VAGAKSVILFSSTAFFTVQVGKQTLASRTIYDRKLPTYEQRTKNECTKQAGGITWFPGGAFFEQAWYVS
jgi:hypothetical protein